jgi:hypothetical protein
MKPISDFVKHQTPDGKTTYYKLTAAYICLMLTVIALMIATGLGWL